MKIAPKKPKLKVTAKSAPRMTAAIAKARALDSGTGPVDLTAFLLTLKNQDFTRCKTSTTLCQ